MYKKGYVYFLQIKNKDKFIKIGFTTQLENRIKSHKWSFPYDLEYLGAIKTNQKKEITVHKMFANCQIRKEWFRGTKTLMNFIKENATNEIHEFNIAIKSFDKTIRKPNKWQKVYRPEDIAWILLIRLKSVYKLIAKQELRCFNLSGDLVIDRYDIKEFINNHFRFWFRKRSKYLT